MTSGLFDHDTGADPTLTGIESRTLRAILQLERRHVAILAESVGLGDVTTERVTQWERSKGRGYPPELVDRLRRIQDAVSQFSARLVEEEHERWVRGGLAPDRLGRFVIVRPKGPGRIMTLLNLPHEVDIRFSDAQLDALDQGGGDFWQRLADAAVVQAAQRALYEDGLPVHVELDTAGEA